MMRKVAIGFLVAGLGLSTFAWPAFALLCAAAALGEGPLRRRLVA